MKIIDMRFRPGTQDTLSSIWTNPLYQAFCDATGFRTRSPKSLAEEVSMLKALHVTHAVVTGRDIGSSVETVSTNPGMLECIQAYPDFFTGFYGIDPFLRMQALKDARNYVKNYGVKGLSIDPAMSGLAVNHALYYPFFALCCEENIALAITTGNSGGMPNVTIEHHAPWLIDKVATDFPELTIIVSHGGYPWIMEMLGVVMRHQNIYLDFSACTTLFNFEQYVEAANKQLMKKVVFASAHPFDHIQDTLKLYGGLAFSDEARNFVMYANAAKLLGL